MVTEFSAWGRAFAPAPVGFQYGYQSDKGWWSDMADPPREIGNALLSAIPNTRGISYGWTSLHTTSGRLNSHAYRGHPVVGWLRR